MGLTLSPNGTLSGTPTANGSFSFTIQAGDGSSPAQTITINVSVRSATPLVITTLGGALSDAVLGASYNTIALQFTGGIAPQMWNVSAGKLPPGMSLGAAGLIGGTPTATGSDSFSAPLGDFNNSAHAGP